MLKGVEEKNVVFSKLFIAQQPPHQMKQIMCHFLVYSSTLYGYKCNLCKIYSFLDISTVVRCIRYLALRVNEKIAMPLFRASIFFSDAVLLLDILSPILLVKSLPIKPI